MSVNDLHGSARVMPSRWLSGSFRHPTIWQEILKQVQDDIVHLTLWQEILKQVQDDILGSTSVINKEARLRKRLNHLAGYI